jgi:succinyl-diaminopimelate desuccinylase
MDYQPDRFAEKYQLALESAMESKPEGGLFGYELEWNLLDSQLRPLLKVGAGPNQHSFVDYLRSEHLSPWLRKYSQLEVFHWMTEWATRPYYHPRGAVYEGRLMEAAMLNSLHKAGREFGERLYYWHGNLLFHTQVGYSSIPGSWHLAKRRYLERCVDLYGGALATAGTHTNLSLPDPMLAWDFIHLSDSERGAGSISPLQLDDYKNETYITATRLMRAFAALFIATSASTPLQAQERDGHPVVILTEVDSVRNLTFPNPSNLDLPHLYRSYGDYLQLSYDLVRKGERFGNNNWTPVRARSFAEPVERMIEVTSEQLNQIYAHGLYAIGQGDPVDEMAHQIEIQNLMARIDIPMARVEVRSDDGGHPLEVDIANLTLKHLLLLRFYADQEFARAFRYDREDIERSRRNEERAARHGLGAEIENPFTGKMVGMRGFLNWVLEELRPLANALQMWEDLEPLVEMGRGGANTAGWLRSELRKEMGISEEVPLEMLKYLAERRQSQLQDEIEVITGSLNEMGKELPKLNEFMGHARHEVRMDFEAPIRYRPPSETRVELAYPDKTSEILALAGQLIRIPSVTACPEERLEEVHRAATFIFDYLRDHGLGVRYYNQSKYPALLAGFPGQMNAPVMLAGHFDVVAPEPDDSQFEPRLEGAYLWGRGAADMKTVVATFLVWLKDRFRDGPPYPPVNLLLVGNEENGEGEPMGTPHVLRTLYDQDGYAPELLIAGERTGERGDELWGEVCIQNRGVMRFEVRAYGQRGHTGTAGAQADLTERLIEARKNLLEIMDRRLTLESEDGWHSQVRFPFIQVGTKGIYNLSPDEGVLGVEVRPIPKDNLEGLAEQLSGYCQPQDLEMRISVLENGVACNPQNVYLLALIEAIRKASGAEPRLGRKLPGTSARFAPRGQGVVWGQTGLGPHSRDERHFIPSIEPYHRALDALAEKLRV